MSRVLSLAKAICVKTHSDTSDRDGDDDDDDDDDDDNDDDDDVSPLVSQQSVSQSVSLPVNNQ